MNEDIRHIKATSLASHCLYQEPTEIPCGTFFCWFSKYFYDQRIYTFNSTVQRRHRLPPHRNRAPDRSYPDSQTSELVRGTFATFGTSCLIHSVRSCVHEGEKQRDRERPRTDGLKIRTEARYDTWIDNGICCLIPGEGKKRTRSKMEQIAKMVSRKISKSYPRPQVSLPI